MALPDNEWLPQAQRLSVGMQMRVRHRREHRHNLVIGNAVDRHWAYCQACKEGGVHMKEHVRLDVQSPEAHKSDLSIPNDLKLIIDLDGNTQHAVLGFLASKGMDVRMLPTIWYSCTRKRILINSSYGWLGRDVTGNAKEKWLTYQNAKYIGAQDVTAFSTAVVVEDVFSMHKVAWGKRNFESVYCALGTRPHDALIQQLLHYGNVLFMFDGDAAGWKGADAAVRRVRGLGGTAKVCCAPTGLDPKDLTAEQIRSLIQMEVE